MKTSTQRGRARRLDLAQRAQLLAAFDRSGLSAAAFARQHQLTYTTFCNWRQRRARAQLPPAFVPVEVAAPTAPAELVLELGTAARLRLHSPSQLALAAQLIQTLHAPRPC